MYTADEYNKATGVTDMLCGGISFILLLRIDPFAKLASSIVYSTLCVSTVYLWIYFRYIVEIQLVIFRRILAGIAGTTFAITFYLLMHVI